MAHILMVIAKKGFRDEEFQDPADVFASEGHDITVASTKAGACEGKLGAFAKADIALSLADVSMFDAIVFVGGPGASVFFEDQSAHRMAKAFVDSGKVVAAICIGPSTLANAGLLAGKRATSYPSERKNLEQNGAIYTDEEVSVDGNIVTANGPGAARSFGEAIVRLLH